MVVTRPRSNIGAAVLRLRSDEQLVALLRSGHDEAFSVIHDRYRTRLLAYALQMLRSRQDAEDVLQDVFERAYLSLRRSSDDRALALRPWLYRIAHNRCIDQLRRPLPPPPESLLTLGAQTADPVVEVDRRDALRRLMIDVGRLPEQQRSALLMRELGGISYADVAEALGVSVPAVKSLLVRARVSLVQAGEARDTACAEIRAELVHAHEGRVRPNAQARRHMRDCPGCREFRGDLRGVRRQLLGIAPAAGPLGILARILGGGGTGGGAAAAWGGSAATGATGGGLLVTTTNLAAGASHVATLVAATVVTAGGAAAIGSSVTAVTHHSARPARPAHRAPARHASVHAVSAPAVAATAEATVSAPSSLPDTPVQATAAALPQPAATVTPAPPAAVSSHHVSQTHINVLDPREQLAPLAPDPGTKTKTSTHGMSAGVGSRPAASSATSESVASDSTTTGSTTAPGSASSSSTGTSSSNPSSTAVAGTASPGASTTPTSSTPTSGASTATAAPGQPGTNPPASGASSTPTAETSAGPQPPSAT
jgi:RNA polymerase sigma factor (sigma-70 family)